ncbi:beta-secretase 1-like [Trichoplusia ni]|uniref:Beta-secretase 1-like n=1 Tax=Trichoplusia ni TaxID=7111 RepID=A0A7E5VYZ7_TRINI|nr:beta-secretase 1-like [Trichoplusia ni]
MCNYVNMSVLFTILQICFVYNIKEAYSEEINLYGDAGQAYSVEAYLGHPHQKLKLLVDTGSTTLAIASYARENSNEYFHPDNSSSIYDSGKSVQAEYSQGMWSGRLVSDFIKFPSLQSIPEVRSDIALITQSHKFFMNGSGWQGLLGLAYLPVGAWGNGVVVESWLDSVDRTLHRPISFHLKLCGPISKTNTTHYGYFKMLDDHAPQVNSTKIFRTPILRKRWYEVGVLSISVMSTLSEADQTVMDTAKNPNIDMCLKLNAEKSIVDSGTTNIRLPDSLFRQVVDELKNIYRSSQVLILDEFWYQGEAACWPEPQVWTLPWLAIDLLSSDADNQYFRLEIPPQNYMRVVGVYNSSDKTGTVSEYCYKLGIEAGGSETVLGYTAMEGLKVIFNRSAGWIGWQTSDCGANARISGPYNTTISFKTTCELLRPVSDVAISIRAAQWALCAISIIAAGVLIYLLAPCIKTFFVKRLPSSQQISLSQAALVEQES